ncbi:hypothetical protein WJX74_008313 [Apatococcus lobatus]|uniref:Uncharacterized protein n=1 Tax=Apatococcus lobatus TaxID=904363 RepID=A0AAW1RZ58_9CHLO
MVVSDSDDESWQGLTCTRNFVFNGVPVSVQEHWGTSIGGSVWEGGVLLAEYLSHPDTTQHDLHGRCIEVGAGVTALPGLVAARLGLFDEVMLTDTEECMEDLQENVNSNLQEHHAAVPASPAAPFTAGSNLQEHDLAPFAGFAAPHSHSSVIEGNLHAHCSAFSAEHAVPDSLVPIASRALLASPAAAEVQPPQGCSAAGAGTPGVGTANGHINNCPLPILGKQPCGSTRIGPKSADCRGPSQDTVHQVGCIGDQPADALASLTLADDHDSASQPDSPFKVEQPLQHRPGDVALNASKSAEGSVASTSKHVQQKYHHAEAVEAGTTNMQAADVQPLNYDCPAQEAFCLPVNSHTASASSKRASRAAEPDAQIGAPQPACSNESAKNALKATGQQVRQVTRLACAELDWENPAHLALLSTFDVVLVADVVYIVELVPALLHCLHALCKPHTVIYLAFYERSKAAADLFWSLLPERFTHTKIPEASFGMKPQADNLGIFMLRPKL